MATAGCDADVPNAGTSENCCVDDGKVIPRNSGASCRSKNSSSILSMRTGIESRTVSFHKSDFDFEEHRRRCLQAMHQSSAAVAASTRGTVAQHRLTMKMNPAELNSTQQRGRWDQFYRHHRHAFFRPKRYIPVAFHRALKELGKATGTTTWDDPKFRNSGAKRKRKGEPPKKMKNEEEEEEEEEEEWEEGVETTAVIIDPAPPPVCLFAGCGSGAAALTVACTPELRHARLIATDLSSEALQVFATRARTVLVDDGEERESEGNDGDGCTGGGDRNGSSSSSSSTITTTTTLITTRNERKEGTRVGEKGGGGKERLRIVQADLINSTEVMALGRVDLTFLIFVLSAVAPGKDQQAVANNLCTIMRKGALLCFRYVDELSMCGSVSLSSFFSYVSLLNFSLDG